MALVIQPDKLKIYQINTIVDEEKDENDIFKYRNNVEQEKKMKINFQIIYETEIILGSDNHQ